MRNNKRQPNPLDEMSLEELWELFPIFLVDPNVKWERQYGELEAMLNDTFKELSGLRISHIGSTAINGIKAKDIVDVLVEVGGSHVSHLTSACRIIARPGVLQRAHGEERRLDAALLHLRKKSPRLPNGDFVFISDNLIISCTAKAATNQRRADAISVFTPM